MEIFRLSAKIDEDIPTGLDQWSIPVNVWPRGVMSAVKKSSIMEQT